MDSANFNSECFVRALVCIAAPSVRAIEAWCSLGSIRSIVSGLSIEEPFWKFMDEEGAITVHHCG
jgi:hypothetical protein